MAPRISLALAIHNHQPVGNFGWVFDEVYGQAYLPMLEALERHPGVRLSLHYTGPLLEGLASERPDFLARLRALVDRDQVEVLGGGLVTLATARPVLSGIFAICVMTSFLCESILMTLFTLRFAAARVGHRSLGHLILLAHSLRSRGSRSDPF